MTRLPYLAALLLAGFALAVRPAVAQNQTDDIGEVTLLALTGQWVLLFDMPDGSQTDWPMDLTVRGDTLVAFAPESERPMPLTFGAEEDHLAVSITMDHGLIDCKLFPQESGEYGGFCGGPMGDVPTLLRRRESQQQ